MTKTTHPRTTVRFQDEQEKERFNTHKEKFNDFPEYMTALLDALENQPDSDESGDVITLSSEKKRFFYATRDRERRAWEKVPVLLGYEGDYLEATDLEFLKILSEKTGMTPREIISRAVMGYGQGILAKMAKDDERALGARDTEITTKVKMMVELLKTGSLPENFRKISFSNFASFTGSNPETLKGWARRNGIYDLIQNAGDEVSDEMIDTLLSKF